MRITTQLYTVRNEMAADTPGTLKAISSYGIEFIEGGGLSPTDAKNWKAILDDCGLQMSGMHYGLSFMDKVDDVYEALNTLGCKTFINPWDQPSIFTTLEGTLDYADKLNKAGEIVTAAGFDYQYHNHDFEFSNSFDGLTAWEHLIKNTDPKFVKFELDVAWVKVGGCSEVEMLEKYGDRVGTLHLKDVDLSQTPRWRIAGTGTVDLDYALSFATKNNIGFGAIELDESPIAPLDAVRESFEFFKSKGFK
jgi:sugar phosphate isomerase/epimerase